MYNYKITRKKLHKYLHLFSNGRRKPADKWEYRNGGYYVSEYMFEKINLNLHLQI